ncbi:MAG TPA: hypothetical protein VHX60_14725 [Acidobacteriaceae bacterium]|nr:hypothetical protein [Acidobacteriaceae bacterium]
MRPLHRALRAARIDPMAALRQDGPGGAGGSGEEMVLRGKVAGAHVVWYPKRARP